MAAMSKQQWPTLMKEVYRVLKPGGWVQCGEFNPFLRCRDQSVPVTAAIWKVTQISTRLINSFKGSTKEELNHFNAIIMGNILKRQ